MTVKRRISLLVAGAGFAASLLFTLAVFAELAEQPFHILDAELEQEARRAAIAVARHLPASGPVAYRPDGVDADHVWLRIVDRASERVYYQSALAGVVELPMIEPGHSRTVEVTLPAGGLSGNPEHPQQTTLRVRMFAFTIDGHDLLAEIALGMNKLHEELRDLAFSLAAGLLLSSLVLIVISHFIAGKILQPIGVMKSMTREISEKNLDQRLPVGPGKDEFNALARTINRMLDRLQHSFLRQKQFLFDTSHELKTPLATMRLAVDDACLSDIGRLPESTRTNLLRMNEQVRRMDRLVKDLLSLSALEMIDTIDAVPLSLESIILPLVDDYRFIAEAQNIRIDLRLPACGAVCGDRERLTRAFSNILDNAIKYNQDGGTVTVDGEPAGDRIMLSVTNTGPGVDAADIDKVFDQFFRAEKSRSIEHGGSGLGLTMVKRIIALHGGEVRMESHPGAWTQVRITLPSPPAENLSCGRPPLCDNG